MIEVVGKPVPPHSPSPTGGARDKVLILVVMAPRSLAGSLAEQMLWSQEF